MAGSVIISDGKAFSLGTAAFNVILDSTRKSFLVEERLLAAEIYAPLENEGMHFVALDEQGEVGFNAFYRAAEKALKESVQEDPKETPVAHWEELLSALRSDPRWRQY